MAFWNIPLLCEENVLDSVLDDLDDWVYPKKRHSLLYHPYRLFGKKHQKGRRASQQKVENGFKAMVDVKSYEPNDIALRVDGDKLIVSGKRHTKNKYGSDSSEFQRVYNIPENVDIEGFTSKINNEGQLEIEAPKIKQEKHQETEQSIQQDDNKFKAVLDVTKYKPEEVSVKVQGNQVIVHGEQKSESKDEDKDIFFHQRQFTRRLVLPETVKLDSLQSKWTKDGTLVIEADKCPSIEAQPRQLKIEYDCDEETKMDE